MHSHNPFQSAKEAFIQEEAGSPITIWYLTPGMKGSGANREMLLVKIGVAKDRKSAVAKANKAVGGQDRAVALVNFSDADGGTQQELQMKLIAAIPVKRVGGKQKLEPTNAKAFVNG